MKLSLSLVFGMVSTSTIVAASTFTPVPFYNNLGYFEAFQCSGDGSVLVGDRYQTTDGFRSCRWQDGIGYDEPGPSQGPTASWASGVSLDGSVICGGSGHAQFGDLEGWVRIGNSRGHIGTPPGHDTSDTTGVSENGNVIVGYGGVQANPNLFEAALYTDSNGWRNLGFLPGGNWSIANAANGDGSVIVGRATSPGVYSSSACYWDAGRTIHNLGNLGSGQEAEALAVNSDGKVIVGYDYLGDQAAWRWTSQTGMVNLGHLPGGSSAVARSVSADGKVVVGGADTQVGGSFNAFIWDARHGMRDLMSVLIQQGLGSQLAGWELYSAVSVRGSGPYVICGEGGSPDGHYQAWIVRLDTLGGPTLIGPGIRISP